MPRRSSLDDSSQQSPTPATSKRTPLLARQSSTSNRRTTQRRLSGQSLQSIPESGDELGADDGQERSGIRGILLSFHTSRFGHGSVLGLVAIDVIIVLAELILALLTCKAPTETSETIEKVLGICSVTISVIFILELISTLYVFGVNYLQEWIHALDAFIIVASFTLDVTARGVTEDIGSLLILGRLWRIIKLAGEATVVDSERVEGLEREVELLKMDNERLKGEMAKKVPSR